ncbi:amino acid ABC transporter permease [Marinomonas algicola]|jgi:polar amino acid transport system permease protein|uniref:amino acid ABC transporter permease n=1 Tax=Marinomonas algicola TaxID=2773454 RepID=UPI001749507F|nr:amino acid ABC transporter permease [Marinomonas algicola]
MIKKRSLSTLPWWLLFTVIIGLLLSWNIVSDQNYTQIFNTLSKGLWTTISVTLIAFMLATLVGLVVALAGFSRFSLIRQVATFYVEIIRGIPVLVILFYIAFVGAPEMVNFYNWALQDLIEHNIISAARTRDFSMLWRAIFALSISYSAFLAEVFRAGIQEIDKGQIEAGKALGLNGWLRFRFIIFPQAIKKILPPLGNDFVAMIKDSALVSVLGVQDITQMGKVYSASTFQFFETYNVVAFMYLVLTLSLSLIIRGLERYLRRNEKH